jgi:hypothetical protein
MSKITITEALAEIPTINKRIQKKQEFIDSFLYRQNAIRDPHEKEGGSAVLIAQEMQSINDLQERLILIRSEIQKANAENFITIGEMTNTIGDWLTWRREVAPNVQAFLNSLARKMKDLRQKANTQGVTLTDKAEGFSMDYIVNLNEKDLSEKIENIENILGILDGQLSLKNATIFIEL